jgi:hypothetical protein
MADFASSNISTPSQSQPVPKLPIGTIVHIEPEAINYNICVDKFRHVESNPNTARLEMSSVSYDARSQADNLFWAEGVKFYEAKAKVLPKAGADFYIMTCLLTHVWYGHNSGRISLNWIHRHVMEAKDPPMFPHAFVLCLLFGFKATSSRKWFPFWLKKYKPLHPTPPQMVEGLLDPANHPDADEGRRFSCNLLPEAREIAKRKLQETRVSRKNHPIRLLEPSAPASGPPKISHRVPTIGSPGETAGIATKHQRRECTTWTRQPGAYYESWPTDEDMSDDSDEMMGFTPATQGPKTSDNAVYQSVETIMIDDDDTGHTDMRPGTDQQQAASPTPQSPLVQVTHEEVLWLHEKATQKEIELREKRTN